jgi:sulfite reductase (NADPH) hemoprotein beta-component
MSYQTVPGPVEGPLADNERLKRESNFLRGTIEQDLRDPLTGGFNGDNFQLIRFHGMYQQDDRDIRAERAQQKLEPLHNVMLRARMPGGIITPTQWLAIDEFARDHTMYGSIRLTTRQTFQFHGVLKPNIKLMHQTLNKYGMDSIATAGDVNRNVLCTSNPVESKLHAEAYEWAKAISEHLLPKTRAYAEIWLDGEKLGPDEEPILGSNYLPRKFKTTVVIPPHNDIDVHANDLNFVAIAENGELVGFNVLVGGGLAMTHGEKETFPRKADDFGFIPKEHTLAVAAAVVTTQRDWGNRVNRKNAKTKYTLERVGVEAFKAEVEKRAGVKFAESRAYEFTSRGDRFGWVEGIDGKHHLTLFIENGRILDFPGKPIKTGLAEIAKVHQGDLRMTANQNLIIAGVPAEEKARIEALAIQYGLLAPVSKQREESMACRPARWPWPKPNASCPPLSPRSKGCWPSTAYPMRASSSVSPAAPTVAVAPCWRRSVWWARRRVATTSISVATWRAPVFHACTARTSQSRRSWPRSTRWWAAGPASARRGKALVTS